MSNQYISVTRAAEMLGVCRERVIALINQGRIKGAQKIGNQFAIPANFTVNVSAGKHKLTKIKQRVT